MLLKKCRARIYPNPDKIYLYILDIEIPVEKIKLQKRLSIFLNGIMSEMLSEMDLILGYRF